jgi:hypothetical protein
MHGAQGLPMDRGRAQLAAGLLLIAAAACRLLRGERPCIPIDKPTSHIGIALWSLLMGSVHGAGMMLVPALMPLCLADNPAREITASGSWALALAAVGVHTAAMLATTGLIATGVCRGMARHASLSSSTVHRQAGTAALALTGALMVVLR